jgi:hypothetical protein
MVLTSPMIPTIQPLMIPKIPMILVRAPIIYMISMIHSYDPHDPYAPLDCYDPFDPFQRLL